MKGVESGKNLFLARDEQAVIGSPRRQLLTGKDCTEVRNHFIPEKGGGPLC